MRMSHPCWVLRVACHISPVVWPSERACLCLLSDLSFSRQTPRSRTTRLLYPFSIVTMMLHNNLALKAESINLLFVTRQLILGWSTDMVQFKYSWLGQSWVEAGLRSARDGWPQACFCFPWPPFLYQVGLACSGVELGLKEGRVIQDLKPELRSSHSHRCSILLVPREQPDPQTGCLHSTASTVAKGVVSGREDWGRVHSTAQHSFRVHISPVVARLSSSIGYRLCSMTVAGSPGSSSLT